MTFVRPRLLASALLVLCCLVVLRDQPLAADTKQKTFADPDHAVAALVAAVRRGRVDEMVAILGPRSKSVLSSGDAVADAQARRRFVDAYDQQSQLERESDTRFVLAVGADDWPFPFPIIKHGSTWTFDQSAGAEEIVARRIGANELFSIEVVQAYVDAQREYAERDYDHDGFVEYAQKFRSSPGKRDGLYWPAEAGDQESPLGPLVASARAEGYGGGAGQSRPRPFHGYYYRILTGQGAAAKGGAYDYVLNGHMIAGFGLVAFPANYGSSGVMTFIVNHDGVVYQRDLGPRTDELARQMTLFNPEQGWTPVQP
jgi:hypothetical protein